MGLRLHGSRSDKVKSPAESTSWHISKQSDWMNFRHNPQPYILEEIRRAARKLVQVGRSITGDIVNTNPGEDYVFPLGIIF